MKTLLCGSAAFLCLSSAALAGPAPLSDSQMDQVSAGWAFQEEDVSNTSWTQVRVYQGAPTPGGNNVMCESCYIIINSPQLSIGSAFGPLPF